MAYDKHTWTCDEPITVERLNHIEDGIANAGGDCGFECEEDVTELTEETVTTAVPEGAPYASGVMTYVPQAQSAKDAPETLRVTFNGTEYECPRALVTLGLGTEGAVYGGTIDSGSGTIDFSVFPFCIAFSEGCILFTENAGTYTVKLEALQVTITTTLCFEKAVQSVVSPLIVEATIPPATATSQSPSHLRQNVSSILEAMVTRGVIVKDPNGALYSVLFANHNSVTIGMAFYDSTTQQTEFEAYAYSKGNDGLRYPPERHA